MVAHTPGPWEYFELDPPERCIGCVRRDFGHFLIPDGHGNGECALYTKADARLIAAAPDLLAALGAIAAQEWTGKSLGDPCCPFCEAGQKGGHWSGCVMFKVHAVIAKAKGE